MQPFFVYYDGKSRIIQLGVSMKNILIISLVSLHMICSASDEIQDEHVRGKASMYKIIVGSTNQVKVQALEETLQLYPCMHPYKIHAHEVASQVSDQPLSLEETVQGAINRAKSSFKDCDFSVGIESGLLKVPYTVTGYMCITVCVIYDGQQCHVGLSSAFECPPKITSLMVDKGLDMNQAFYQIGLTKDQKLGSSVGAISILTDGRIDRISRTKEAIVMALIKLERQDLFSRY